VGDGALVHGAHLLNRADFHFPAPLLMMVFGAGEG
jgi:hypothetical protein